MTDVQFREIDAEDGPKLTAWQRAFGVAEDGEFYVPAAIAGNEEKVMMCASYDGVSTTSYKGHLYVPLTWAKKEFPDADEVWSAFERRMKDLGVCYNR